MGLTLIEAATGCVKEPESRLEHLAVIKTFARGELLSWLPFMNIVGGASDEGHAAARALLQPGAGHPAEAAKPQPGSASDDRAQGLLPYFLWADQIPTAADWLGQRKEHQLPSCCGCRAGLWLLGAA